MASAFQDATLRYARSDNLQTIEARGGTLCLSCIPKEDFMNFVSLAKANRLSFYIDSTGLFEVPSIKKINVVYSSHDEDLLRDILDRIVNEKVEYSHLVPDEERQPLQILLQETNTPLLNEPQPTIQNRPGREVR